MAKITPPAVLVLNNSRKSDREKTERKPSKRERLAIRRPPAGTSGRRQKNILRILVSNSISLGKLILTKVDV